MKSIALAALLAAAVPAGTAAAAAGHERLTLTNRTGAGKDGPTRVVAVGAIRGRGTVRVRSSADNRIDHMTLRLRRGSVFLVAVEKAFAVHPDPARCRATTTGHGTWRITGGTRAYRGARGRGTYRRRGVIVGARGPDGSCLGQNAAPAATRVRVRMTGRVALDGA
jgi:hypothetical protein